MAQGLVDSCSSVPTALPPTATWSTRSAPTAWRCSRGITAFPSSSRRRRRRSTPPRRRGTAIAIELRDADEVTAVRGHPIAPPAPPRSTSRSTSRPPAWCRPSSPSRASRAPRTAAPLPRTGAAPTDADADLARHGIPPPGRDLHHIRRQIATRTRAGTMSASCWCRRASVGCTRWDGVGMVVSAVVRAVLPARCAGMRARRGTGVPELCRRPAPAAAAPGPVPARRVDRGLHLRRRRPRDRGAREVPQRAGRAPVAGRRDDGRPRRALSGRVARRDRRDPVVVTWAPASAERRRRSGFDHGELLARAVARRPRPARPPG